MDERPVALLDEIMFFFGLLLISIGISFAKLTENLAINVTVSYDSSDPVKASGVSGESTVPFILHTWEIPPATEQAWSVLSQPGSSRLDAIEAGCAAAEDDPDIESIGAGNHPDEIGEVTLDALIFDGESMSMGAVGDLRGIPRAIGVARAVMERTKHSLLVGESAAAFAKEMGFQPANLSSSHTDREWKDWKDKRCQPNFRQNVVPDPSSSCGPYSPGRASKASEAKARSSLEIGQENHDTIGLIAIDEQGKVAVGTSTNGAKFKVPGRVGDSPIVGAGGYARSGVGAAAETGDGDVMMRFLPSFLAVEEMSRGVHPVSACRTAMDRIASVFPDFNGAMVVAGFTSPVTVTWAACCHNFGDRFTFSYSNHQEGVTVQYTNCTTTTAT